MKRSSFAGWKRFIVFGVACLDVVLIALGLQRGVELPAFFVRQTAHSETTVYGWYYKPRTDGKQPDKNTEMAFMEQYGAVSIGDPDDMVIYITFDAGFENGYTPSILDALAEYDAPAAFFVVGHYIESNPDLIKRMVDEGHLVCNHSMRHKDMTRITDFEAFKKEITDLEDVFYETTGTSMPPFYRPPEGKFTEKNLRYVHELGYTTVFWSFAYCDWYVNDQPSHEFAMEKIISRTHPGEVVLLHSTSATNADVLGDVMAEWERMGYRFGSLYELVDKENR